MNNTINTVNRVMTGKVAHRVIFQLSLNFDFPSLIIPNDNSELDILGTINIQSQPPIFNI